MGTPVANAVTSRADGHVLRSWYIERPASGPADGFIACAWRGFPGWRRRIRLLPDGCVDLTWNGTTVFVAPATSHAVRIQLEAGCRTIGVRLFPYAAVTILGRPVPHLDSPTPLADLWPQHTADPLVETLRTLSPDAATAYLIQIVNERARHPHHRPDPLIAAFIQRLTEPGTTVEAATRSVGASSRTMRRRVHDDTALAPKPLQEILRFRRALTTMTTESLTRAAIEAGYYDQAHLNRQVRKLTGTTPTALARNRTTRPVERFVE